MPKNIKVVSDDALTPPLVVLRKVNLKAFDRKSFAILKNTMVRHLGATYTPLGVTGNSITEGELPWFEDGYILNDHPRVSELTNEIMEATTGFAVARTDSGEIMVKFGKTGLKDAVAAVEGATTQLSVMVTIPEARGAKKEVEDQAEAS